MKIENYFTNRIYIFHNEKILKKSGKSILKQMFLIYMVMIFILGLHNFYL